MQALHVARVHTWRRGAAALIGGGRLSHFPPLGARCFSRSSALRQSASFKIPPWLTVGNVRKHWREIAAGATGLVVVYGLSRSMYWVAGTFMTLDFEDVFWFGFGTGVVSVALLAGGGLYAYSRFTIQTAPLQRWALAKLARDARVRAALGQNISGGSLRAYAVENGHFSPSQRFAWVAPRAQILFEVSGEHGTGFATAEAVRQPKGLVFNLLALDMPPAKPGAPAALYVVHGKEEKLHVRGSLRGFLQTERAAYVPQDRAAPTDDDLVREQAELPAEDPELAATSGRA